MTLDFSFFAEPPNLTHEALLTVEALAPLSMVTAQPGSYFRSQAAPTDQMLYGMLENALGWHLENDQKALSLDRKRLFHTLRKQIPKSVQKSEMWGDSPWLTEKLPRSGNAFFSFLQFHLRFTLRQTPEVMHYDDLWTRLARRGDDFIGGSRNYDYRLEPLIGMLRQKEASLLSKSKADIKEPDDIPPQFVSGVSVYQGALKSAFPEYYYSPTPREYVCPKGAYRFRLQTTPTLANLLRKSVTAPAAPLYLGSNDGWVEAHWEDLT